MTNTKTVTSTADLVPDGVAGYAKSIAVFVGGLLAVLAQFITEDPWRTWVTVGIAVCTYVATRQVPNKVKPLEVAVPPTPPANLDIEQP